MIQFDWIESYEDINGWRRIKYSLRTGAYGAAVWFDNRIEQGALCLGRVWRGGVETSHESLPLLQYQQSFSFFSGYDEKVVAERVKGICQDSIKKHREEWAADHGFSNPGDLSAPQLTLNTDEILTRVVTALEEIAATAKELRRPSYQLMSMGRLEVDEVCASIHSIKVRIRVADRQFSVVATADTLSDALLAFDKKWESTEKKQEEAT